MKKLSNPGPRYIPTCERVDAQGRRLEEEDSVRFARLGPMPRYVHRPLPGLNVARIRERMHLTQRNFARRFGIPLNTLRHWEDGTRRPRGAALVLLHVIRYQPVAVDRALKNARLGTIYSSQQSMLDSLTMRPPSMRAR
jgi:putative transcriptional regulator